MRRQTRRRVCRHGAAWAIALVAAGCGEGPTDPPPGNDGAALVIAPGALLFAEPGQTHRLRAYAIDPDGDTTEVAATFESSNPAIVTIDAGGVATGGTSLGSAQITATSGDLTSAPILALRATPVVGALLVADSQVAGGIEPLSTRAEYGPGWRYRIRLRDTEPVIGQVALGTGSAPVAGRVVSVTPDGDGVFVTLELLEIGQLFAQLEIDETIPLSHVAPAIPAMRRGAVQRRLPAGLRAGTADLEFEIGSFECSATGEFAQDNFTLDAGALSLDHTLALDVALSSSGGLHRLAVVGSVQASQAFKPRVTLAVNGEIECHAILFTIPLPINGPLSFFIGGQIPLGAGFKLAGALSFPDVGADITLVTQGQVATGIDCTGGCHPIFELSTSGAGSSFKPVLPAQFGTAARLKLDASAFARVEFAIGNALLQEFQYEILAVKLGLTQSFDLATREGQAADPAYASGFSIRPLVYGGTESEADSLGIWGIELPALEFEPELDPLDASPTGTFTITPAAVAAGSGTAIGELATFTVTLGDPSYLGAYAVEGVELRWQKTNGNLVTLEPGRPGCSDLAATTDQLTFTCQTDFRAEHAGVQTFYAFLKTRIFGVPIPVPLEIAADGKAVVTVSGGAVTVTPATITLAPGQTQEFTATIAGGGNQAVTWSGTGGTLSVSGNTLLYTAGTTPGTFTVTATSTEAPAFTGTAAVTIVAPAGGSATLVNAGGFAQAFVQFPSSTPCNDIDESSQQEGFTASRSFSAQCSGSWTSPPGDVAATLTASAAGNTSYQLSLDGTSLVSVTAGGTATAAASAQGQPGIIVGGRGEAHSADLWFDFEVQGTVTVTLSGQVSSSSASSFESPRAFVSLDQASAGPVYFAEQGGIGTTLTLGPGRYTLRGDAYADAPASLPDHTSSNATASFNVTMTVGP